MTCERDKRSAVARSGRAVILLNGDSLEAEALRAVCRDACVVCANGGYQAAVRAGVRPSVLLGDLDSSGAEDTEDAGTRGVHVEAHPTDKEQTDAELALRWCLRHGFTEVCVTCVSGSRLDHTLATLLLIAGTQARRPDLRVWGLGRGFEVRCACPGVDVEVAGEVGDVVSLIPVGGDARGVTTEGLKWPLLGSDLPWAESRGVSNVLVASRARVSVERGSLLVFTHRGCRSVSVQRCGRDGPVP